EKLGEYSQAIKLYHAILVHFPKQVGWTFWHTPLYMGKLALDKIEYLTRKHPELGIKLVDAKVEVQNGYDTDTNNDKFSVNPGHFIAARPEELNPRKLDLKKLKVKKTIG